MKTFQKTEYGPAHVAVAHASMAMAFEPLKKSNMETLIASARAAKDIDLERAVSDWQSGNLSASNQRLNNALIAAGLKDFAAHDVGAFERAVVSAILDLQALAQAALQAPTAKATASPAKPS